MSLQDDFKIEYAKSSRSTCKHCASKIEMDSLRIGILEQSDKFDGEIYVWHHVKCFFGKWFFVELYLFLFTIILDKRPDVSSTSSLKGFDLLRPSDQPKIKKFTDAAGNPSSFNIYVRIY